jgi:hypothetical protein
MITANLLTLMLLILMVVAAVYVGYSLARWEKRSGHVTSLRILPKKRPRVLQIRSYLKRKVDPELKSKLFELVGGDSTEAERLVGRARFGRPNLPESSYWELAIQRLEARQKGARTLED